MNKKILRGSLAGVAVVALAAGGGTFASFSDFGNINGNSLGAGFLKLDLGSNGTGSAALDFSKLKPGDYTNRTLWIASNDGQSVPKANLYVTLHNLQDTAAPCATSLGKAQGESDSGVTGCGITGNTASGTPSQGNLSRVLSFQGYYYPGITDPAACAALNNGNGTYPSNRTSFFATGRGDLNSIASAAGTKYELLSAPGVPLVLSPGQAGCIGISAGWVSGSDPVHPTTSMPSDNSAQGDAMTFDTRFDLVQSDG